MSRNTSRQKIETQSESKPVNINFIDPLAKWLNTKLDINQRLSPTMLRKVIWMCGLAIIYIFFQHRFDNLIRKTDKMETSLQESRATYIFYKSKYLFASKQSEISKRLEHLGFEKNGKAPLKIATNQ